MAVPSSLPTDKLSAHGVESRVDIFEEARPRVVNAWLAVCGRGSFVENPLRCIGTQTHALGENIAFSPIIEDLLLKGDEVERGDGVKRHAGTVHGARQGSYAEPILGRN
ncbi:unannotated protein [freshwater metagenome]|uniref:Unannotated protein n=1 Tax=freshwater metagenome TaxID=449393 RepID=A0A6J6VU71_9ZZZZ